MSIKNNTTNLQSLLEQVNALPEAGGGIDTSDATAEAAEIFKGETAYVNGDKVTGTFTIDNEIATQEDLIAEIAQVLSTKAAGDSNEVLNNVLDGSITELYNTDIENIRPYAFYEYESLTAVDLPNVTSIGYQAFENCISLTSANLPNVETIGSSAFYYCPMLKHINIPKARFIDENAFTECIFLTQIKLSNIESLGYYAFTRCTALSYIDLSFDNMEFSAPVFDNCVSLSTLILRSDNMCTIFDEIFNCLCFENTGLCNGQGYVYVPRALLEEYQNDEKWSSQGVQFRVIEDYTIDGTVEGEIDPDKLYIGNETVIIYFGEVALVLPAHNKWENYIGLSPIYGMDIDVYADTYITIGGEFLIDSDDNYISKTDSFIPEGYYYTTSEEPQI